MNENKLYFIWLQKALGYASEKLPAVISTFGSAEAFYKATYEQRAKTGVFTAKQLDNISSTKLHDAQQILDSCEKLNIDVICFEDENYPAQLKEIYNPPAVIYTKGKTLKLAGKKLLSVVGSRNATNYGYDIAFRFAHELSKSGLSIVSGGANGIDTMSLKGALNAQKTDVICVVATGLDICYPKANDALYEMIEKHGTMVSEFPPGVKALPAYFPIRNRIISGISKAVLIVEAAKKSGAIITANLALEQGREVFAVPGSINSQSSKGTNMLIKDGATPATDIDDILEVYSLESSREKFIMRNDERLNFEEIYLNKDEMLKKEFKIQKKFKETMVEKTSLKNLSDNAKKLYDILTSEAVPIDELAKKTQMDIINAQTAAMELLLESYAYTDQNGRYYK